MADTLREGSARNSREPVHVMEKWPNGRMKLDYYTVEDGSKVGFERHFFDDGLPEKTVFYQDGKIEGEYITYWKSGAIRQKYTYKNGKQDGLSEEYSESGIKVLQSFYQEGMKHGAETTYYDSRMVKTECNYCYDRLHGSFDEYYENGVKKSSYYYANDALHGPYVHFYESGNKCYEMLYVDGQIEGKYLEFYPEVEHNVGSYCEKGIAFELQNKHGKRIECMYKNGVYHGLFTAWNVDGEVVQKSYYWNGIEIPKIVYDLYVSTSGIFMGIA